ncbi:hypothetical protein ACVDG8_008610 [Mesorhizobium sp. ORM8.1]
MIGMIGMLVFLIIIIIVVVITLGADEVLNPRWLCAAGLSSNDLCRHGHGRTQFRFRRAEQSPSTTVE